ncbi:hypothetical protein [Pseudoalteromonas luteoviolacea]|uniref:Uncharacterized protein n=1 Tax=Pseudoalteromonas luteoviolacea DSM 6061 TaxID=1365250 RepID=A0A167BJ04_9GAMM|nr:hypothetical protein [Pseudoalteromonas luteoviolacea]KZN46597.1 hypothetical protein N475_25630 [Pseudoalteromonas luteoviolacea DSM 6061]MBE0388791.1 hypothetical protein [Pseudoalteromonas luteoviolacea DSM 6061]MBE0389448.1 hypothetical protein [Pseudoalteromonas luteoviolacea DSM 6061]
MLKVLQNTHDQIRRNSHLYIDNDNLNEATLLKLLAKDARFSGVEKIKTTIVDDWHVIYAERSWMVKNYNNFSLEALFEKFCPLPEEGVNAIRAEVIVSAFSKSIFVKDGETLNIIKGESPSEEVLSEPNPFGESGFSVGLKL